MSMRQIHIPESLRFYCASDENTNAIQQMIDTKKVPKDLSIEELARFYKAQLAAREVMTDYWLFLKEVWDAVWGSALSGVNESVQEIPGNQFTKHGMDLSLEYVWNDYMLRGFKTKKDDVNIWCVVSLQQDRNVRMSCYISENDKYEISNSLDLPSEHWLEEPEDDERISSVDISLSGISGDTLDVTPLYEAAKSAVEAMKTKGVI